MADYFNSLFTSLGCTTEPIIRCVQKKVTEAQNKNALEKIQRERLKR